MPAFIAPLLAFALGVALGWVRASAPVRDDERMSFSHAAAVAGLFAVLVVMPVNAYFLAFAGDWAYGYFIDSLGWAYYQQGKYAEALRELQRAAERAKDDPEIFDHLADAYVKNGKVEEAIAAWEKAVSVDKDNRLGDSVKKKLAP